MAKTPAKSQDPKTKSGVAGESISDSAKAKSPRTNAKAPINKAPVASPEVIPAHVTVADVETPKAVPEKQAAKPERAPEKTVKPVVAPPAPTEKQSGGIFPLLLGGLIAGGLGFGAAHLWRSQQDGTLTSQLASQATKISTLEKRVNDLPSIDLNAVEAGQAEIADAIEQVQMRLDEAVASFDERIAAVERQPSGDGTLQGVALSAYEAELAQLRAELDGMTNTAMAQLESARAEAAAIEQNADAAARAAAARAALARVQGALETGGPLGAALSDLEAAIEGPAPEALIAVQDGAPTLASLQAAFPDAAREALITARREGVSGEETSGFGAFLRNQLDARSVTPREGDSTDAILSRAESSLRGGRLADTLAELSALPEVARAELSDWQAKAEARADAMAAVEILSTSLNAN